MEALTVLLIGITSTLGFITLGVGVFILDTEHCNTAAWQPRTAIGTVPGTGHNAYCQHSPEEYFPGK
jgi:hypothetical protein